MAEQAESKTQQYSEESYLLDAYSCKISHWGDLGSSFSYLTVKLIYVDQYLHMDNSTFNIALQLADHQVTKDQFEQMLTKRHKDLNKFVERRRDLENTLQYLPQEWISPAFELVKIGLAPAFWARFTTQRKYFEDSMFKDSYYIHAYTQINKVMEKGEQFLDQVLENQSKFSTRELDMLHQWKDVQEDLTYLSRRLAECNASILEAEKKDYELFFPRRDVSQVKLYKENS